MHLARVGGALAPADPVLDPPLWVWHPPHSGFLQSISVTFMTLNARTMSHQPGICRSIASSYGVTYGLPATGTDRLCDREHQSPRRRLPRPARQVATCRSHGL